MSPQPRASSRRGEKWRVTDGWAASVAAVASLWVDAAWGRDVEPQVESSGAAAVRRCQHVELVCLCFLSLCVCVRVRGTNVLSVVLCLSKALVCLPLTTTHPLPPSCRTTFHLLYSMCVFFSPLFFFWLSQHLVVLTCPLPFLSVISTCVFEQALLQGPHESKKGKTLFCY